MHNSERGHLQKKYEYDNNDMFGKKYHRKTYIYDFSINEMLNVVHLTGIIQ